SMASSSFSSPNALTACSKYSSFVMPRFYIELPVLIYKRGENGNNCSIQASGRQNLFRILCRARRRQQNLGYRGDSGMVGLERPDQRRRRQDGSSGLSGAGSGLVPRQSRSGSE